MTDFVVAPEGLGFPRQLWRVLAAVPELLYPISRGLSDTELLAFQRYWPYSLPHDVVAWYRLCSVGCIGSQRFSLAEPDGDEYSPYVVFAEHRWRENGWLVVGGDGSGDYYVLLTAPGPDYGTIHFIDQCNLDGLRNQVAASFAEWLALLAQAENGGPGFLTPSP